jgi:hypothetical protein
METWDEPFIPPGLFSELQKFMTKFDAAISHSHPTESTLPFQHVLTP